MLLLSYDVVVKMFCPHDTGLLRVNVAIPITLAGEVCMKKLLMMLFFLVPVITGCSIYSSSDRNAAKNPVTVTDYALDTYVSVTIYDDALTDTAKAALSLCHDYENIFSADTVSSELYEINNAALSCSVPVTYEVSEPLADIISKGLYYGRLTDGAFDITIAPLSSLWNISGGSTDIPDEGRIKAALDMVDYHKINAVSSSVTIDAPAAIDLGGIAKGYIADNIKSYLIENGVDSAIINLGGNILCVGTKPDGSAFTIGIKKPFSSVNEAITNISVHDLSVVTAGVYERYFYKNDKLYHHILSPYTGKPADTGLYSVTVISPASADGDCLSTACLVMGLEKGKALIDSLDGVYAVFVTDKNELVLSDGLENSTHGIIIK